MLARTSLRRVAALRTYATAAAPAGVPPVPPTSAPRYPYDDEPALHNLGYPHLPNSSRQLRDPRGANGKPWDDKQERLNYNEALQENEDLLSMWAPDVHKVKPSSALAQLCLMFGLVGVFALGVYEIRAPAPMLPRAYPNDGLVKELSGTSDAQFAARTDAQNQVDDE
ncbi:hypothetical protein Rhopal_000264-T1 [Rhodotorula paludigena]|uniref:Uncharacterized protein n=1 Tax=Rhodotorula paludigena TaxID=86838 RepID=A0AAV5G4D5_9BASI|nr:hypothetical protein Rhopal_000264-T1 [Rhodotorula paludigena]